MNLRRQASNSLAVTIREAGVSLMLCLASFWTAHAQPLPLRHAETNACGIDYSHPEKYLATGTQTTLTPEDCRIIERELQLAPVNLASLKKLYDWKDTWFKSVKGGGIYVGQHTVRDLLRQRTLTGCHDHGLVVVSILRHCGVPAVFVDATGIEWALEYPDKTRSFRGHVFVEVYWQNAWLLLDSVTGEYVSNYDPLNPLIPLKKHDDPKGFYVMFKGLDPADYGITRLQQLTQTQVRYARMIQSEIHRFRYPNYVIRRL